jgi:hypothetical protein
MPPNLCACRVHGLSMSRQGQVQGPTARLPKARPAENSGLEGASHSYSQAWDGYNDTFFFFFSVLKPELSRIAC